MRISFTTKNNIGLLSLYRPEKLQAIDEKALDDLLQHLHKISGRKKLKGLIIFSKNAKAFSSGLDLFELKDCDKSRAKKISQKLQHLNKLISKLRLPSIAAIDGYALGAGLEISMSCKFRVANKKALFGLPEVALGFLPGGGGTQLLPSIVGASEAQDIIVKGKKINASQAHKIGLIDRVVLGSAKDGALIFMDELLALPKTKQKKLSCAHHDKHKCAALPKSFQKETESFAELLTSKETKRRLKKFALKHQRL